MFENFNADHSWRREWIGREVFQKTIKERVLRQWQQTYLEKLLCLLQCFFTRTNGRKMEPTSRQTQCLVSKILQRYIKELKLTVLWLSFDRIKFFNMANLFLPSRKALVMCYCFRAPIKTFFFWRLSNDCQIVRSATVSGPPNRKKPYNKHLISLVFSVRTVNYGSSFFSIDFMARALRAWAINRWKKTRSVIYSTDRKLG